ncbi:DUF6838 family protein [Paenibacillus dendritiformis]|uniref:phage tail terminator family protein n=1 Tax=Paenibacillus dendritiformis TaxID=130049 RepID=UPI00364ECA8D
MTRLTRAQLNKAINDKIKAEFPSIPIQSRDVTEGFERPSFYVNLETRETETFQFNVRRDMTCRIRFFPTDRYEFKEEAYDIQDRLEELFGLNFPVLGRTITLGSAETDIIDKVVHYDFDFSYYDVAGQEETGEAMQELDYHG